MWIPGILTAALPLALHLPPPVHIEGSIRNDRIEIQLLLWAEIFEDWWNIEAASVDGLSGADLAAFVRRAGEDLAGRIEVAVDGLAVAAAVREASYRRGTEATDYVPYVLLRVEFPALGPPRQVGVQWTEWQVLAGFGADRVPVLLETPPDRAIEVAFLTGTEPLYVWHAAAPAVLRAETPAAPARSLRIPAASLVLLAAIPVLLLAPWPERWRQRPFVPILAAVLAAAPALLLPPLVIEWSAPPRRPPDREAALIFEDLLRNIYRAFDYDSESAIYDTLERSVAPGILDGIYNQIYGGLILRDEGGAVSKPRAVSVEEVAIIPPGDGGSAAFRVRARWLVQGSVTHLGHTHIRTNRHEALYDVVPGGDGSWRIGGSEILSQTKTGDDIGLFGADTDR